MSPVAITLLMLVALAGFAYLTQRKLALVARLQPLPRVDQPVARLREVLVNGLFQSRMIRRDWVPGVMHTFIFLGFVSLLLRKMQLLAIGYYEPFAVPGLAGGLFASFKDLIELGVVCAVSFAFYRRLVLKPRRLEPNREALLVLSLIMCIMITDFLFDGFRFALLSDRYPLIAHERGFAFIGGALGTAFSGLSPAVLSACYQSAYWVQMFVVFSFLVLLPAGEHFHIVTALPMLFFRRGGPTNVVPKVDLEAIMGEGADDTDMRVGVRTARDLYWKEGLDAFTCTECGRCKDACPTFLTDKPLSLKWVNDSIKHHLLENRELLLAPPPAGDDPLPALVDKVISEDTLWACTTCGYCEAACPIELEHLSKFYRMRQQRVMMEGQFPHELTSVFDAYEVQGNPWGLASSARADWAKDLGVQVVQTAAEVTGLDYLFYVGSAQSFDPRGQKIARAFVRILQQANVRFAILGPREGTTGECVRRVGNEMLFQQLAGSLVETLNGLGVTRIVTCDPHAMNSLRNEYPEFGGHYEVVHHTRLIAQLLSQDRIKVERGLEKVIFHDPCYLGRHNGEFDAPRSVLGQITRDAPMEFPLHRQKAMCCGAGGGRMWMEETIGKRINITRLEQALPQAPLVIATACPYCAVMMTDAVAAVCGEDGPKTRDIAELVAEAMLTSKSEKLLVNAVAV